MDWNEALPLLQESHTGVAVSITPAGRAHSTVVSTAVIDGKIGFASPRQTVKVRNIQRTGRAAVTVIKLDTRRYVTVEGAASVEPWQDTPAHIGRLKEFYLSMGRPVGTDEEFTRQMRNQERSLILIAPERLYGSLRQTA
jgi:PPOX class probable F420-dependent enzyme